MSNISTFSAMTTARLGIYASQKAMEVTGNNITNINTKGYSRQTLNQKSVYMGGCDRYVSKTDVKVGGGTRCTSVSQLRDPYLDIRYRNEMSSVGSADAKLSGLEQLSTILDEVGAGTDGEGVIEAQFNDLIEQIQNMVTNGAGKDEYDTLVRSSASGLVTLFNTYADKLSTLRKNNDTSLRQDVDTVNDILSRISSLNNEIHRSAIHGGNALELQDERNLLVDELSQYVRINVSNEPEDLGGGTTVDKLVIRIVGNEDGSPSKNATLVDGGYVTKLSITQLSREVTGDDGVVKTEKYDDPNYGITLAALKNTKGETKAGSVDTDLKDNDLYGALQSMRELLTEKGEYASAADLARDPNSASKRGVPYYINTIDALANKLANVLNAANTMKDSEVYVTDDGGNFLDSEGNITTDRKKYVLKDEYSYYKGGALFSNSGNGDSTEKITAGNISISASWANGDVKLLQSKKPHTTAQSTDNTNLTHILYLMTSDQEYKPGDIEAGKDSSSKDTAFFTGGFQEMLNDVSSTLANDKKTTTAMLDNYNSAADELYVARDSVAGVDLNDEAVSMMQYQKSYSAACRMLTTLDSMLDKLINGTGIT